MSFEVLRVKVAMTHVFPLPCGEASISSQYEHPVCCLCSTEAEESRDCSQVPVVGKVGVNYTCPGICCVLKLLPHSSVSSLSHDIIRIRHGWVSMLELSTVRLNKVMNMPRYSQPRGPALAPVLPKSKLSLCPLF